MRQLSRFLFPALVAGSVTAAPAVAGPPAFASKPPVRLKSYLGLWYEVARTPNSFEDNRVRRNGKDYGACFNATAQYGVRSARDIDVLNTCSRAAADGSTIRDRAKGIAQIKDPGRNRKLAVAFGSPLARALQRLVQLGRPNYWIYCLGPVRQRGRNAGQYGWAVVSGRNRDGIFVLSRDPRPSRRDWSAIRKCMADENLPAQRLIFKRR